MEDHMGHFMKKCLVWKLSNRVNCYLALAGKPLNISVRVIEWNTLNAKCRDRSLRIPLRDRNGFKLLSFGLSKNKPSCPIYEAGKYLFLVCIFVTTLASNRHAKHQGALATFHDAA